MSENSRLESIIGVTELKSNKPAKVKSTFEAINFFKKNLKFASAPRIAFLHFGLGGDISVYIKHC